MEDEKRGLLVHEVNNTVEFRGASNVSEVDIAGAILDYAVNIVKKMSEQSWIFDRKYEISNFLILNSLV